MLTWIATLALASAPRPGIAVEVDPCLELDADELALVHETLELRLGAGPEYLGAAAAQRGDTLVLLDCGAADEAVIRLVDPLTQTSVTRALELPARPRRAEQLAWSAAALIRATWMTLALDPRADPDDGASRRAARVARRPPSAWHLGDGFVVRNFYDARSPALMLGEQVEVVHRPLRHLAWKADGELAFRRVPVVGETRRINTLSVSVAPALLAWGEIPSARPRGAGTVAIYGGAGLRVGGVRMRGGELGSSDGFEAFAGPLAMARVSVSLGRYVSLALDAEAGWILHGPEQPDDAPLSFVGPWTNGVIVLVSSF